MLKKKIVFFIESLDVGGAEKSLVTLLNVADFTDYSVDLVMLKKGAFLSEVPSFVNCIFLNEICPSLLKRIYYFLAKKKGKLNPAQYFWDVFKKEFPFLRGRYDFAIAYGQGFSTYYVAERVSANAKFCWLNTDYNKAGFDINFDFPFYKKYSKVIAVSQEARTSLVRALDTINQSSDIRVIKDIANEEIIINRSKDPLCLKFNHMVANVVSVGRLINYKGFAMAIDACDILLKKGYSINWFVIGEGNERENLEKQIKSRGLENHFFLPGADLNPYPYIKNCDIYVQTSMFEGLGLTVIEAALLHKPIVCTNFSAAQSLLTDEETGLIAEMNADSIASKIQRLLDDKSFPKKLSANLQNMQNNDKEESLQKFNKLLVG